jgi:hypothetical protein
MVRCSALAVFLVCAVPSPALANPSFTVAVGTQSGRVTHSLSITAGGTPETVTVDAVGTVVVTPSTQPVEQRTASGPSVARCQGRWSRMHEPFGQRSLNSLRLTIAAGATAVLSTTVSFAQAPWPEDDLDVIWGITPATGQDFDLLSRGPHLAVPQGVELDFGLARRGTGDYAVSGTAGEATSGRVELWGYAPGKTRAKRLAVTRVRDGVWAIPQLSLTPGRWELYARYRTTSKAYANDASVCGTLIGVPQMS